MFHRLADFARTNVLFIAALAAGASLVGCQPFMTRGWGGGIAEPQRDLDQSQAWRVATTTGQVATTTAGVAGVVGALPTPAAPIAHGVANFAGAYSATLEQRLAEIAARQAQFENELDKAPSQLEVYQAMGGAFLAGIANVFFRRRTNGAPLPGVPATPGH